MDSRLKQFIDNIPSIDQRKKTIEELDSIDLSNENVVDQIVSIYNKAGFIGCLVQTMQNGVYMTRLVRKPAEANKDFLKYRPASMNNNPQRATIAFDTAFYGSIAYSPIHNMDALCASECSYLIRNEKEDPDSSGVEHFVASRWYSTKDLELAAIVHPSLFADNDNQLLKESIEQYNNHIAYLRDFSKEKVESLDLWQKYHATKFAERICIGEEYKYNLSAIFAKRLMIQYDGIIYPSVQFEGKVGLNIAVKADVVDKYFVLGETFDLDLYKYKKNIVIDRRHSLADETICQGLGIDMDMLELLKQK